MRKNLVGVTTLAVALSSVTLLGTSYAEAGTYTIPAHPLIPGPIGVAQLQSFKDAATLWLSDALVSQGMKITGQINGFSETTAVHTSVYKDAISETVYRHKSFMLNGQTVLVGGPPEYVRPMTGTEYAALVFVVNNRLAADLNTNLQVDRNGIRGNLSAYDLRTTQADIQLGTEQTAMELGNWILPTCQ